IFLGQIGALNAMLALTGCASLKKILLPSAISILPAVTGVWGSLVDTVNISVEEITEVNWTMPNPLVVAMQSVSLISFKQPTFKITYVAVEGISVARPGKLVYFDVDWSTVTGNISLMRNSLPVEEINRIFTALPVVTGKTINVLANPGYATCNKTIATAKGWTVS
ncbi:MAG: hypothetical protein Q8J76_09290, partial [Desulfobulbaceae bacterium]|nr:hypothetical protein [Desulfobulbaceae bacterium]